MNRFALLVAVATIMLVVSVSRVAGRKQAPSNGRDGENRDSDEVKACNAHCEADPPNEDKCESCCFTFTEPIPVPGLCKNGKCECEWGWDPADTTPLFQKRAQEGAAKYLAEKAAAEGAGAAQGRRKG